MNTSNDNTMLTNIIIVVVWKSHEMAVKVYIFTSLRYEDDAFLLRKFIDLLREFCDAANFKLLFLLLFILYLDKIQ